jgi:hypothetical protein
MIAGVIPHVVERVVIGNEPAPDAEPGSAPPSVGAVFEAAAAQGIPTHVLVGSVPAEAAFSPEHRERIQRALDDGQIVIAPANAIDFEGRPRLGWWLVDPATGATVDQLDDGGGTAAESAPTYVVMASGVLVSISNLGPQVIRLAQQNGMAIRQLTVQLAQATNRLDRILIQSRLDFRMQSNYIPSPWNAP